jgi:hypothetical protein
LGPIIYRYAGSQDRKFAYFESRKIQIILIQTVLATDTRSQTNWDQDPDPG